MAKILTLLTIMLLITGASSIDQPVETVTYKLDMPAVEYTPYHQWNISYPVSNKEVHCLALNVYFEARGEDPDGQFAVADVVMHRVNHSNYPNTICGVVQQGVYYKWKPEVPVKNKCHFSWFCDRKPDIPMDSDAFEAAMYVAETVLNDEKYIPVIEYALFYHARHVSPHWAEKDQEVASIGNHLFY